MFPTSTERKTHNLQVRSIGWLLQHSNVSVVARHPHHLLEMLSSFLHFPLFHLMGIFKTSHPYFDEASEYITLLVGLGSTLPLKASNEDVVKLANTINILLQNRQVNFCGKLELKTVPAKMTIYAGRKSDIITVYGCDNVFKYITGQSTKFRKVRFSVRKNPLKPLPSPGTGQTRVTGADVLSRRCLHSGEPYHGTCDHDEGSE